METITKELLSRIPDLNKYIDKSSPSLQRFPFTIANRQFEIVEMTQDETSEYVQQLAEVQVKLVTLSDEGAKAAFDSKQMILKENPENPESFTQILVPTRDGINKAKDCLKAVKELQNVIRARILIPVDDSPPVDSAWLRKHASHRQLELIDLLQAYLNNQEVTTDQSFFLETVVSSAEATMRHFEQSLEAGEEPGSESGLESQENSDSDPS